MDSIRKSALGVPFVFLNIQSAAGEPKLQRIWLSPRKYATEFTMDGSDKSSVRMGITKPLENLLGSRGNYHDNHKYN